MLGSAVLIAIQGFCGFMMAVFMSPTTDAAPRLQGIVAQSGVVVFPLVSIVALVLVIVGRSMNWQYVYVWTWLPIPFIALFLVMGWYAMPSDVSGIGADLTQYNGSSLESVPEEILQRAEQIVNDGATDKMVILRADKQEDGGWIFEYDTEEAVRTQNKLYSVPGSIPLLIRKDGSFEYMR